jgi:hypothetical protein
MPSRCRPCAAPSRDHDVPDRLWYEPLGDGTERIGILAAVALAGEVLTCADDTSFTAPTIFSLDRRNGTLIEATEGERAQILHRLSPRVHGDH